MPDNKLTIPATPAASLVNSTDLIWIWQNGQLLRAYVSQILSSSIRGTFTLPANSTSYTVTPAIAAAALYCTPTSDVILIPQSPDAALQGVFAFATSGNQQFVVSCASSPSVDMLFNFRVFN